MMVGRIVDSYRQIMMNPRCIGRLVRPSGTKDKPEPDRHLDLLRPSHGGRYCRFGARMTSLLAWSHRHLGEQHRKIRISRIQEVPVNQMGRLDKANHIVWQTADRRHGCKTNTDEKKEKKHSFGPLQSPWPSQSVA